MDTVVRWKRCWTQHQWRCSVTVMVPVFCGLGCITFLWPSKFQYFICKMGINKPFFFFFFFLGLHLQHMKVPRLGVKSELQPLVYATATATPDPSWVCSLHLSSQQRWILNQARPEIEPISSWILVVFINHWATKGTPRNAQTLDSQSLK